MSKNKGVNFLIVGVQKSGSALTEYLRQHSEIEMSKKHEMHFFDYEQNFVHKVD